MQSKEYPDLLFVPARSFGVGRTTRVRVICVHTTEGHEDQQAAENGGHNDAVRTDGTSAHYFHDPDSTVQCVLTSDRAHSAREHGNEIGVHHELCGKAGQGKAGWADPASQAIIVRAAKQAARDARKYGIPVRRLTSAEVRNGALGFCGHNEITLAFPEDHGTHWDPGSDFPWAQFLSLVRNELEGKADDMSAADAKQGIADAFDALANTTNDTLTDDTAWGRQFRTSFNQAVDFALADVKADIKVLASRPAPTTTVVLSPDQLADVADLVVSKLTVLELAFRPAS